MSETYLKFGVRFFLHPFFVKVLKYFGLTIFQITPKGWAQMIGLFDLFMEHGMSLPTVAEFAWFYSIKGDMNDDGFHYFAKRPSKGVAGHYKDQKEPWSLKRVVLFHSRGPGQRHLCQA